MFLTPLQLSFKASQRQLIISIRYINKSLITLKSIFCSNTNSCVY